MSPECLVQDFVGLIKDVIVQLVQLFENQLFLLTIYFLFLYYYLIRANVRIQRKLSHIQLFKSYCLLSTANLNIDLHLRYSLSLRKCMNFFVINPKHCQLSLMVMVSIMSIKRFILLIRGEL